MNYYPNYPIHRLYFGEVETPYSLNMSFLEGKIFRDICSVSHHQYPDHVRSSKCGDDLHSQYGAAINHFRHSRMGLRWKIEPFVITDLSPWNPQGIGVVWWYFGEIPYQNREEQERSHATLLYKCSHLDLSLFLEIIT